jgi:hypothetical protein
MPIDPSIVDPSTLTSIKQTFDTFRTAIGLVKDLKSISGGTVYFPAYCSIFRGVGNWAKDRPGICSAQ